MTFRPACNNILYVPVEMDNSMVFPHKKIMSRTFRISGTLIITSLYIGHSQLLTVVEAPNPLRNIITRIYSGRFIVTTIYNAKHYSYYYNILCSTVTSGNKY